MKAGDKGQTTTSKKIQQIYNSYHLRILYLFGYTIKVDDI